MAWFQYYLIADGSATILMTSSVSPPAGQDVVEITAGEELPPGQWDPVTTSWVPVPAPTIITMDAFKVRFTDVEWNDFISFSRGSSPSAIVINGFKEYLSQGSMVNLLDATRVIAPVNTMTTAPGGNILTPTRAAEILDPENQPSF